MERPTAEVRLPLKQKRHLRQTSCQKKKSLKKGNPANPHTAREMPSEALVPFNLESAIIHAPVDKVKAKLLSLDFSWWNVKSVTAAEDAHSKLLVGSVLCFEFNDGAKVFYQLAEVSLERKQVVLVAVRHEGADMSHSSHMHTFKLLEITATSETLLYWTTDFSSDVARNTVAEYAIKKQEAFASLNRQLV
jgi:hypothetical protein